MTSDYQDHLERPRDYEREYDEERPRLQVMHRVRVPDGRTGTITHSLTLPDHPVDLCPPLALGRRVHRVHGRSEICPVLAINDREYRGRLHDGRGSSFKMIRL